MSPTYALKSIEDDKLKHLQVSMLLGYTGETLLHTTKLSYSQKIIYATSVAFAIGIGKELYDKNSYGVFSSKDLVSDIFGAVSGAVLSNYLNKNYFIKMAYKPDKKSTKLTIERKF